MCANVLVFSVILLSQNTLFLAVMPCHTVTVLLPRAKSWSDISMGRTQGLYFIRIY